MTASKGRPEADRPLPAHEGRGGARTPFSTAGLVLLTIVMALLLWFAGRLLLLIFAAILLAIFLRTGAALVARATRLTAGWSLLVTIILLLAGMTAAGWLLVPRLSEEARQLTDAVPQAFSQLTDRLRDTTWGAWILDRVEGGQAVPEGAVTDQATSAAYGVVDALINLFIVVFVGLYLAVSPLTYVRGLLRLVPIPRRRRAAEVLFAAGYQLRWWLIGQLLAMLVVGLLMWIGLSIIGVSLAFALGVLAGLLEFIPTIGPPLAVVPALLLALVNEPQDALYVLVLYGIVQTVESYLLTPLVQERVVHLPPVVTISAQVFFALTMGGLGLLVAVPSIAVVKIAIQMWYVEDVLSDDLNLAAEREARKELAEAGILE